MIDPGCAFTQVPATGHPQSGPFPYIASVAKRKKFVCVLWPKKGAPEGPRGCVRAAC